MISASQCVGATGAVGPGGAARSSTNGSSRQRRWCRSRPPARAGTRVAFGDDQLEVRELAGGRAGRLRPGVFSAGAAPRSSSRPRPCAGASWWSTSPARSGCTPRCRWSSPRSTRTPWPVTAGSCPTPTVPRSSSWSPSPPIHRQARITHMTIATYQAVSGRAQKAVEELLRSSPGRCLQAKPPSQRCTLTRSRSTLFPTATPSRATTTTEETKLVERDAQDLR